MRHAARAGLGLVGLASLALAACNSCCPRQRCCPPPSCCPPAYGPGYSSRGYAVPGPGPGVTYAPAPPSAAMPPAPAPMPPPPAPPPPAGNTTDSAPDATAVPTPPPEAPKSLFDRLGGLPAISAVTDEFLARIAANETIKKNPVVADKLAKADMAVLRQHLIDQICQATGGPCTYKGRDMKTVHTGMNITEEEWDSTAADLTAALDKFNVPKKEKDELFALLVPMKADIVGQ